MIERLSGELNGRGQQPRAPAVKKREDTHKMAEAKPRLCPITAGKSGAIETRKHSSPWPAKYNIEDYRNFGYHGAHRRRQDHDHRACAVLHGQVAQDWRKSTTAPRPWTGWSRSRSAASHHVRRDPRPSGKGRDGQEVAASTSSTPPGHVDFTIEVERFAARARRRPSPLLDANAGVEPQTETRLAPGRQVSCPAHDLLQQDGQDRCRLLPLRRDGEESSRCGSGRGAAADRCRERFRRRRRSHRDESVGLEVRESRRRVGHPRDSG